MAGSWADYIVIIINPLTNTNMADEKIAWINKASVDQLQKVKGVDRNNAEDIVNFREQNGEFTNWEDLKKVPGLNEQMIRTLKEATTE